VYVGEWKNLVLCEFGFQNMEVLDLSLRMDIWWYYVCCGVDIWKFCVCW